MYIYIYWIDSFRIYIYSQHIWPFFSRLLSEVIHAIFDQSLAFEIHTQLE